MRSSSRNSELRRARPLLGTLVEIRARGVTPAAIGRAFAAIERAHTRMSPHAPASDLGRLHAAPVGRAVRVDPWTWRVLAVAQQLARETNGIFDVTVRRGHRLGSWRDIELLPRHRVRRRRAVKIDLGGIAKGFAVDRAIAALRAAGATSGVVNAGGDLRVFGGASERVFVRHPAEPATLVPLAELRAGALATSANYFDAPHAGRLRRPGGRRLWLGHGSVSVHAPTCLLADALTKLVAAIGPRRAASVLRAHRAAAVVLRRDGRAERSEEFHHAA